MKTVEDYLIQHKIYEEEIAGYEVKLKLVDKCVVMQVDDYPEYLIAIDGEASVETEIRDILEDIYGANIRFCDVCGIPYDMGFIAGDGEWYCCQSCFDGQVEKYGWRETEEAGEWGGYYEHLNSYGEWEDTGIYYTEWN